MALTIQNLLVALTEERKKAKTDEGNFSLKSRNNLEINTDDDFILIQQANDQWPTLFNLYFLSTTTRLAQTSTSQTSDDDLVFYVTRKIDNDIHRSVSLKIDLIRKNLLLFKKHSVEVFRHHDTKRQPKLVR